MSDNKKKSADKAEIKENEKHSIEENVMLNTENVKKNRKMINTLVVFMAVLLVLSISSTIYLSLKYSNISKVVNDRGKGSIETNIIVGEGDETEADNTVESVVEEKAKPDVLDPVKEDKKVENEDKAESVEEEAMIHFMTGGYRFNVPNKFECMAIENIGVIIYQADSFQMKIVVKGRPYDEVVKDEDSIKAAVEASGGVMTSDITSAVVNDNKYTFFRCTLSGDEHFVIYGETPDGKSHTGGQIELFNKKLSDEDLLSIYDSIARTAVAPEVTVSDNTATVPAVKDDSTITFGEKSIKYNVPTDLYYSDTINRDNWTEEIYWNEITMVSVGLTDKSSYENAKEYIKSVAGEEFQDKDKVGDNTVYYYVDSKEGSSGSLNQHVYAACGVGDYIFYVEYTVYESDVELSFDVVKTFFEFY